MNRRGLERDVNGALEALPSIGPKFDLQRIGRTTALCCHEFP
jgi:hypothetical protein